MKQIISYLTEKLIYFLIDKMDWTRFEFLVTLVMDFIAIFKIKKIEKLLLCICSQQFTFFGILFVQFCFRLWSPRITHHSVHSMNVSLYRNFKWMQEKRRKTNDEWLTTNISPFTDKTKYILVSLLQFPITAARYTNLV